VFENLLNKLKFEYNTIKSLQNIINILDNMTEEEKFKNSIIIDKIKNTIKGYGTGNKLTNNQHNTLVNIIQHYLNQNEFISCHRRDQNELIPCQRRDFSTEADEIASLTADGIASLTADGIASLTADEIASLTADGIASLTAIKNKIIKIDSSDIMYSVILNLYTNLSYNVLSSSINLIIFNYFDMVKDLHESYKYIDMTTEIENMLKNNTWTESGFYSEPNQYKLIEDLQSIMNKYLF
jgi:hypothetical protein